MDENGFIHELLLADRLVAFQRQNEVGGSGGVISRAEDFVLIAFERSNPGADVSGVLLGIMRNGALGGKLIGAGGGGFLMFLCEDRGRVRQVMAEQGLEEVRFRFDFEGTKVVIQ